MKPTAKYVNMFTQLPAAMKLFNLPQLFKCCPCDYISPYYRDESILLGLGFSPYTLMLQLLAKAGDIFTGGREYYSHPNYRGADKPTIIHQSSATGMQAIPATGIAQGLRYLETINSPLFKKGAQGEAPIVVCSLGDASLTEGEVSEAFQFAVLKKLPIIYLVQDNDWGISVSADEARAMNAAEFAKGFKGLQCISIDGSDFFQSYEMMKNVTGQVRQHHQPFLVHAKVPLLNHHTSGVRKEFYRSEEDLALHVKSDPLPKLKKRLMAMGIEANDLNEIEAIVADAVKQHFQEAVVSPEPEPSKVQEHIFVPTPVTKETGDRRPGGNEKVIMVDAALFAIREIMEEFPEAVLYGQDVGQEAGRRFQGSGYFSRTVR